MLCDIYFTKARELPRALRLISFYNATRRVKGQYVARTICNAAQAIFRNDAVSHSFG